MSIFLLSALVVNEHVAMHLSNQRTIVKCLNFIIHFFSGSSDLKKITMLLKINQIFIEFLLDLHLWDEITEELRIGLGHEVDTALMLLICDEVKKDPLTPWKELVGGLIQYHRAMPELPLTEAFKKVKDLKQSLDRIEDLKFHAMFPLDAADPDAISSWLATLDEPTKRR